MSHTCHTICDHFYNGIYITLQQGDSLISHTVTHTKSLTDSIYFTQYVFAFIISLTQIQHLRLEFQYTVMSNESS